MALKQNIIYIYFKGKHQVTSKSQYQYNRGQYLYFADLNLPQAFEVHFSNKDKGESKTQIGSDNLVEIPDEYFWNGALQIYVWIYLHSKTTDGETIYEVRIPLTKRAKPTDEEPLPVQQSTIDRAIAELNNAVDITTENANKTDSDKIIVSNIKEDVITLKENIDSTATTINQKAQETIDASGRAETSAQNAATSENKALNYSQQAEQSAQSALESKNIAQQKSEIATNASNEALGYRDEALEAKNQAVQAKQNIVDYRDETKGYRDETLNLKNNVQTLKGQVEETAEEVESISNTVKEDAQSANQSASSASQSANSASQSANSASQSANQAEEFKNQSATNVTHYPKVVDGYWYVWDASKNEYVNTNVDARGVKGDKGDIGNGIENTVFNSDYTLTITFTDGTSYTTPSIRGEKGIKGDVGNGIASTVLNNDYTLTINFTDGTQYITPPIRGQQGEKGDTGKTGESGVYIGTEPPIDEDIDVWIDSDGTADDIMTDVKVNGTSIVTNGVANVPIASNNDYGVVKTNANRGVLIGSDGALGISGAGAGYIKNGATTSFPLIPANQHISTFYGLAKIAGHDEKSSTLPAGQYSEEAKIAIQKMLGIYEPPYELLNDFTLEEKGGFDLTADMNGTPYDLRNVIVAIDYSLNVTEEGSGYGRYYFYDASNHSVMGETGRFTPSTTASYKYVSVERIANVAICKFTTRQNIGWYGNWNSKYMKEDKVGAGVIIDFGNITRISMIDAEPTGSRIRIYGQRVY